MPILPIMKYVVICKGPGQLLGYQRHTKQTQNSFVYYSPFRPEKKYYRRFPIFANLRRFASFCVKSCVILSDNLRQSIIGSLIGLNRGIFMRFYVFYVILRKLYIKDIINRIFGDKNPFARALRAVHSWQGPFFWKKTRLFEKYTDLDRFWR